MSAYAVELKDISKKFGNFLALNKVNLKINFGEIHALFGENGAGKSTIMSILFGSYKSDSGSIIKNGDLKIGMVHQHFQLVDNFSVLDNVMLGEEGDGIILDREWARLKLQDIVTKYSFNIDINEKVENLSICAQQKTEILKMLYKNSDILIFDEPTSILTPEEIDNLLNIMKNLKKDGKTIIFITHKIAEIVDVADRISVLKKGELVDTVVVDQQNKKNLSEQLSKIMIGENSFNIPEKKESKSLEVVLKVENLHVDSYRKKDVVKNVSFDVKKGEIVGIIGVDGNGQRELVYVLAGLRNAKKGNIFFKNVLLKNKDVQTRNKLGISHIPGNQHKHGLILDFDVSKNLIIRDFNTPKFSYSFLLKKKEINNNAKNIIDKYGIKTPNGISSVVKNMSGGNQQKLIVAREIERNPSLLIAVQPTRGIDYAATRSIYTHLIEQKNNGVAILLVSFELSEIFELSDRILVMFNGAIVGEFNPQNTTPEELGLYMSGAKKQN
ncbi:MAG: ABC transporter ATP-binding protein [Bacilli bacterium]|nr:ABC transporter ATP-binding protein [Bacilli bacterium]